MKEYIVTYHWPTNEHEVYSFFCMADDLEHAMEQCEDAYGEDCRILSAHENTYYDNQNTKKTIVFDDSIVEIMYNPNVKKYPYLLRLFTYSNEKTETRMTESELQEFNQFINDYLNNIQARKTNYS